MLKKVGQQDFMYAESIYTIHDNRPNSVPRRKTLSFLFLLFFFSGICFPKKLIASDQIIWQTLETKYTIIHYQNQDDLEEFDKNIDYPVNKQDLKSIFSSPDPTDLEKTLTTKVDAIYRRAQRILDMRKRMAEKVSINLYKNKTQLQDAFYRIYKKRGRLRAWYIYEFNTIYLNLQDMHEGMLAHEMAHSIIDHYLTVRPPPASAEILARYVDKHLFR